MKVAISVIGRFHSFDLAREMLARDALAGIFSGYPRFKLRREGIPQALLHTFPYVQGPYMAFPRRDLLGARLVREWENFSHVAFDRHVAARIPECDVFVGLSGHALQSGRAARRLGARYVCDRGSSHIRFQDRLLREEHDRWGVPFSGIDPRTIEREEAEYEESDLVTVPSNFTLRSFVAHGVRPEKLRMLPYGVNLGRFRPTGAPAKDRFDVLFIGGMSLRKGLPYLLQAYRGLQHPKKSLAFAGAIDRRLVETLRALKLWCDDAQVLGHVPQEELRDLISRKHVLVLPSVEEGLAMVQAQAMACGCPVIASEHTGASDLFEDGREGYIVPVRDADAILQRLQGLADSPQTRDAMSRASIERVRRQGGWREYGEQAYLIYQAASATVRRRASEFDVTSCERVGFDC